MYNFELLPIKRMQVLDTGYFALKYNRAVMFDNEQQLIIFLNKSKIKIV